MTIFMHKGDGTMEIQVSNIEGKAVRKIELPESIFGVELNDHVLHMAVKAYQANRRQGTHAVKTISFVSGGGKKPFKQKGTGSARQGSSRSAIHPGGGVLHGPHPRDYRQYTTREIRQLALKIALSDKLRHGKLIVVDDFALSSYSTKYVIRVLKAFSAPKAMLSDERKDDFLFRSSRNLHNVACVRPDELNAENVLRYESLIMSETALNALQQRFEEKERASV